MSERYWITGTQLGRFMDYSRADIFESVMKLVNEIEDKQCLDSALNEKESNGTN